MVNKFPIPYLDYRRIKNKLFDMTIVFPQFNFISMDKKRKYFRDR